MPARQHHFVRFQGVGFLKLNGIMAGKLLLKTWHAFGSTCFIAMEKFIINNSKTVLQAGHFTCVGFVHHFFCTIAGDLYYFLMTDHLKDTIKEKTNICNTIKICNPFHN